MKKHKCAWKVCKLSFPTIENVLKSNTQIPFFKKLSHPSQLLQLSLFHYKNSYKQTLIYIKSNHF